MVTRQQRLLVFSSLAIFALAIVLLISSTGGYTVNAVFDTGGQLVKGANVTVGGAPVGIVDEITLTSDNLANVKMSIRRDDLAPFHRGTKASIRLTSLSGVANRYVAIEPGPNNAKEIPSNGLIEAERTESPVDLDLVFNTFTPKVRKNLQRFLRGGARQYADDPATVLYEPAFANEGLRWVAPFFDAGARLAASISNDDRIFEEFLVQTERATGIFAAEKEAFSAMWANLTAFSQAVAVESDQLDQALAVLPTTLREGAQAMRRLRPAMEALEALSDESQPISDDLAPLMRRLRPLLRNAAPTLRDIRAMIRAGGADNDLTELLRVTPAVTRRARSAFPASTAAMQLAQPVLDFIRPYAPELTSWISHYGLIAANYDANGHYVRIQTAVDRFTYDGSKLTPKSGGADLSGYPRTGTNRCPGTGTQPASDGSSPFLDDGLDCDPSISPPGP